MSRLPTNAGGAGAGLLRQYGSGRAFEHFDIPLMAGFEGEVAWMVASAQRAGRVATHAGALMPVVSGPQRCLTASVS
ncbi:hypothetical protein [Halomonas sp. A29]|uniref:hypothetical protein n=1 Tax=Halomonas sp. A29 TaxID=3102786 RepID=UPI00398A6195